MDHSHHNHAHAAAPTPYHDHGGGEDDGCMTMHSMVFHAGVCQEILFPGWKTTTALQLFGSCVAIFLVALLYEGLRMYRDLIFRRGFSGNETQSQMNITKQECGPNATCSTQKIVKYSMLSYGHAIQTALHVIQIFVSYLLMLVFMTYNVWLCLALLLGTGVGYFVFAWKKESVVDFTEHCH